MITKKKILLKFNFAIVELSPRERTVKSIPLSNWPGKMVSRVITGETGQDGSKFSLSAGREIALLGWNFENQFDSRENAAEIEVAKSTGCFCVRSLAREAARRSTRRPCDDLWTLFHLIIKFA